MTRVALCFPGQGSQAAGMADAVLDSPVARALLAVAREEGLDLEAALHGGDDDLRPTNVAQPALLLVELSLASALPRDLEVTGVAGHSVGEFAAVSTAGAWTAEDAMRLVVRRGREMAAMTEGTMAAVIGLDGDAVEAVCAKVRDAGEVVVVANLNAPGQVVVSGTRAGVGRAGDAARAAGARRVVPLNVSGAFHSPLMAPAARRFAPAVEAAALGRLRVPVACNVTGDLVEDASALPAVLTRQLESPVRWMDCVRSLVAAGAEILVEVGPGQVLTGLARRIAPDVRTLSVATPLDAAALASTLPAPA